MSASAQRAECYGKMFPDFTRLKRKERLEGQAYEHDVGRCLGGRVI